MKQYEINIRKGETIFFAENCCRRLNLLSRDHEIQLKQLMQLI
jgi:hypothetical protein